MTEDIQKAIEVLKKGGVILYPTDTIWGLGCDATNPGAVDKIYQIKKRDRSKSMIVLFDTDARLPGYINEMPEVAWELLETADKPLTLVLPGAKNLAANLPARDGSIAIRITREIFSKKLVERFKKPIVSTSANFSGQPAPHHFKEINPGLVAKVDYAIKWRQEEETNQQASSIIKLGAGGEIQIIRK
jgi:L-threonylcarbamoyladenylate synthase